MRRLSPEGRHRISECPTCEGQPARVLLSKQNCYRTRERISLGSEKNRKESLGHEGTRIGDGMGKEEFSRPGFPVWPFGILGIAAIGIVVEPQRVPHHNHHWWTRPRRQPELSVWFGALPLSTGCSVRSTHHGRTACKPDPIRVSDETPTQQKQHDRMARSELRSGPNVVCFKIQ